MNGWNVLIEFLNSTPSVMLVLLMLTILVTAILFAIGFSRRGMNFIRYGFGQLALDPSLKKQFDAFEKRFDDLAGKMATKDDMARLTDSMATKDDIARLDAKIVVIETNHFGHLKNYLGILNGVLLDRSIIDNETKARLDNELRGM